MRRALFVVAMLALTAGIVLGAARGLGYEPPNERADGPGAPARQETQAEIVEAATRGCAAGGGTAWMGQEGKVWVFRCRPWLTVGVTR